MSDHFFACAPGNVEAALGNPQKLIVVGTSTAGSSDIELRVPDALAGEAGTVGDRQRMTVILFLEALLGYFADHKLPIGG